MLFVLLAHTVKTYQRHEKNASREDGLTGMLNARALGEVLAKEIERSRRFAHPLSVAHIACENFGQVSGKIGAALADGVLRLVAECMRAALRGTDAVARAYDDEFVAVLAETDEKAALLAMEKLESRLRDVVSQHYPELIFSIGVISFATCRFTQQEVLDMAEMALYEARRLGRIACVSK
ncbi:MAG: GGDEF domain-containing protein [Desulfovibrionaceae bacterium]|nr:GGDEF domain-containing protein [Desulfovibrionaceae bacterium]MBF0512551.1 GGDEF domain-containing protein [Desulfovibrionaceae bacterium]